MAIPAWADKQFEKLLQAAINGDLALLEVEVSGRPRYAAALRLLISETTTAYTHLALMLNENGEVRGVATLSAQPRPEGGIRPDQDFEVCA
jgi:hypothetical protein